MPLAGSVRCKACRTWKKASSVDRPHRGVGLGRRCRTCANYRREWQPCARCATTATCEKVGGHWLCRPCADAATLRSNVLPKKRTIRREDQAAYLQLHLSLRQHVDLWLIPRTPWCDLLLARFCIWRRHGLLGALLIGPPIGVHFRDWHGVWHVNSESLADHLVSLHQSTLWPSGHAPILVTAAHDGDLDDARQVLPPAQGARLHAFPHSLSEWMATTAGWRSAFASNPLTAPACLLSIRVRAALGAAGLPQVDAPRRLDELSTRGNVFRALHSGSRH